MSTPTNQRAAKPVTTRTGTSMSGRTLRHLPPIVGLRAAVAGGLVAAVTLLAAGANADPTATPGTPIAGKTPSQLYAAVGADAFAELTNQVVTVYNAQTPAPTNLLESFDAINPVTGAAGENIVTKPGCTVARPNGANAGVTAITLNQKSDAGTGGDGTSYCIDWVRSSRAKGTAAAEANLTFYAQSRDAVSYATIGNAYAPTTPLTTAQLKDIFTCVTTDWSQVGGQAGPIHVYLPPASAATLTFFLQALGTSLTNVNAGCNGLPTVFAQQQNDGRTMNGDPMGIAPYAVTKWAAQSNERSASRTTAVAPRSGWSTPPPRPPPRRPSTGSPTRCSTRRSPPVRARRSDGCSSTWCATTRPRS